MAEQRLLVPPVCPPVRIGHGANRQGIGDSVSTCTALLALSAALLTALPS